MEVKLDISYDQILALIKKLPRKDMEKLNDILKSELDTERSNESLQELILQAPIWSDEEYNNYFEARRHINKSRIA
jgi:hypothetical protein